MKTVIHIPHDGQQHPEELLRSVIIPKSEYLACHEKMRDAEVKKLISDKCLESSLLIEFELSRLLCDPERFIGAAEPMEKYGMGFCYERAYDGRLIKRRDEKLLEDTLRYYRAHHGRLDAAVSSEREVLFIDLHSFSEEIIPKELLSSTPLPDICIGADSDYTPQELTDRAVREFRRAGFSVAVNYPYSGTMVPNAILRGECSCSLSSIMLEVNKAVYLDGAGCIIPEAQMRIRSVIDRIVFDNSI